MLPVGEWVVIEEAADPVAVPSSPVPVEAASPVDAPSSPVHVPSSRKRCHRGTKAGKAGRAASDRAAAVTSAPADPDCKHAPESAPGGASGSRRNASNKRPAERLPSDRGSL